MIRRPGAGLVKGLERITSSCAAQRSPPTTRRSSRLPQGSKIILIYEKSSLTVRFAICAVLVCINRGNEIVNFIFTLWTKWAFLNV
jgi:hypothetical protein